jgi:hypothetical protein
MLPLCCHFLDLCRTCVPIGDGADGFVSMSMNEETYGKRRIALPLDDIMKQPKISR